MDPLRMMRIEHTIKNALALKVCTAPPPPVDNGKTRLFIAVVAKGSYRILAALPEVTYGDAPYNWEGLV